MDARRSVASASSAKNRRRSQLAKRRLETDLESVWRDDAVAVSASPRSRYGTGYASACVYARTSDFRSY